MMNLPAAMVVVAGQDENCTPPIGHSSQTAGCMSPKDFDVGLKAGKRQDCTADMDSSCVITVGFHKPEDCTAIGCVQIETDCRSDCVPADIDVDSLTLEKSHGMSSAQAGRIEPRWAIPVRAESPSDLSQGKQDMPQLQTFHDPGQYHRRGKSRRRLRRSWTSAGRGVLGETAGASMRPNGSSLGRLVGGGFDDSIRPPGRSGGLRSPFWFEMEAAAAQCLTIGMSQLVRHRLRSCPAPCSHAYRRWADRHRGRMTLVKISP